MFSDSYTQNIQDKICMTTHNDRLPLKIYVVNADNLVGCKEINKK